jgi:superfamily II RNA helicase
MVKVCSITEYPTENETKYKEYFEKFSYPLHTFQKWAIEGIVEGHHVLVTAPTGSGKSLPAEFAVDFFHSIGKKVIYCSPIKSLSNQKFNDFTLKYPHISVGIVTGDVRNNPDANVLVMTTEILLNKLYQIKSNNGTTPSSVSFEMDIEHELGCVIFDEIHYINDEARGHNWENSIMLLPCHIQMIGLSATLDDPVKFAQWIENKGSKSEINDLPKKIVYLTSKTERAVPLIHYSFVTVTQSVFKQIKDKAMQEEIKSLIDKPHIIQNFRGKFNDETYFKISKMLKLLHSKDIRVKRPFVLNQVAKYLTENEMTPAICYIFSIKQIEVCCKEITTNLLEFDSKVPYIAQRECELILRQKLPNYEEYLHLPEYINLVKLLEKGIAVHHSKMLPILREIVEIFFARGFIKLLFATETVAIGLNLPVKTCIFTDIYKHDGSSLRILQSHEYTQSAGRAGRLGLDTVGHVIHLNNLIRDTEHVNYKRMMNGNPQILTSKFKISFNLVLNLVDIGNYDLVGFSQKSMITGDLNSQQCEIEKKMRLLEGELDNMRVCCNALKTPWSIIESYIELQEKRLHSVNKKRKEIDRQIQQLCDTHKFIENDKTLYQKIVLKENEIADLYKQRTNLNMYLSVGVENIIDFMKAENCILDTTDNLKLTLKGKIASQIREVHCLVFAELLENNIFDKLTAMQIASLLSCFTNISVSEDFKEHLPFIHDTDVNDIITRITEMYNNYQDKEMRIGLNTGIDYYIHYDLLKYLGEWTEAQNIAECKLVLQKLAEEKNIFLGEFVKAILKINNISSEMEKIAELTGNILLLSKLKEIPLMTLKYVITNQSLYI